MIKHDDGYFEKGAWHKNEEVPLSPESQRIVDKFMEDPIFVDYHRYEELRKSYERLLMNLNKLERAYMDLADLYHNRTIMGMLTNGFNWVIRKLSWRGDHRGF